MGGTFDPIHCGHLFAAEEARSACGLQRVVFVPTGTPPHKHDPGMATAAQRYEMTMLAISDNPFFDITRTETDRTGDSFTVETLQEMKTAYPGAELFLILGADAVIDLPNWKQPFEISSLCTILVINRMGYDRGKILELPERILRSVRILDTTILEISSTDIRDRMRRGHSVRYLLPEAVRKYVMKKNLYSRSDGESI